MEKWSTVPVPDVGEKNLQSSRDIPNRSETTSPLRAPTLGQVVAYFKYKSTKELNAVEETETISKFWQRNYFERVIRNEQEMTKIWDYIETNPLHWAEDGENPVSI